MRPPLRGETSIDLPLDPPVTACPKLVLQPVTPTAAKKEQDMSTSLPPVIAEYVAGVNAFDVDAIVATFAEDAYVNDARREISGAAAIRRWVEKEIIGDHVTMEPIEVVDHYGESIVRSRYDGTYDKSNLPDELVLTDYFVVRDGKIVSLKVIFNQPSPY
jgi:hypothetical protein